MVIGPALALGVMGLMVGSFLNVVVHRVPKGLSVVRPRSRCPGCENEIQWRDNIPVLSWVLLRGRCRHCRESISARYPAIELSTGLLFAVAALRFGPTIESVAFATLFAVLVAVTAIDIELRLIPKRIVWAAFAAGVLLLGAEAARTGEPRRMVEALAGSLGAFVLLFVVHLISPRGMGFGDVRLAVVLGLFLGWLGPAHVGLGVFLGFVAGGAAGVVALAAGRSRKSSLPFGPFLALGTFVAVVAGEPILDWYLGAG